MGTRWFHDSLLARLLLSCDVTGADRGFSLVSLEGRHVTLGSTKFRRVVLTVVDSIGDRDTLTWQVEHSRIVARYSVSPLNTAQQREMQATLLRLMPT